MPGVDQPASGHREADAILEQRRDPAERKAALCVEDHGQRDRLRTELHGGGAEGISGLPRVPALHAAVWHRSGAAAGDVPSGHRRRPLCVPAVRDAPSADHAKRAPLVGSRGAVPSQRVLSAARSRGAVDKYTSNHVEYAV
jgi:hypothetical protein